MNKISSLISSLDLYGKTFNYRFSGKMTHKTKTGFVFTTIAFFFFLCFLYFHFEESALGYDKIITYDINMKILIFTWTEN